MRILFIPPNDWITHPTPMRHHFLITRLARKHDCETHVLRFEGLGGYRPVLNPDLAFDEKVNFVRTNSFGTRNPASYYILNFRRIWKLIDSWLRKYSVDVVLNSNILPSAIATRLSCQMGIPMVYDFMEYYPQSASAYFQSPLAKFVAHNIVQELMHYVMSRSDAIVTVSDFHAELVRRTHPTKAVHVIPNGVDLEFFRSQDCFPSPAEKTISSSELRLVYVGSVDEWVDLEVVLEAVFRLKREGYHLSLTVVGGSHGRFYLKRLRSIITCYDLESDVVFTGFIPYRFVPVYLKRADVAIAPYRNVFKNCVTPLKIPEYLACKKIVLSTPLPEIRKRFGSLISFYDDAESLMNLLKRVCSDRDHFELKLRDVENALGDYSWDILASRYYDVLKVASDHRRQS